jgi:hypothetical protein
LPLCQDFSSLLGNRPLRQHDRYDRPLESLGHTFDQGIVNEALNNVVRRGDPGDIVTVIVGVAGDKPREVGMLNVFFGGEGALLSFWLW